MNTINPHFRLGQRLAASHYGADASELNRRIGQDAVMSAPAAAPFNRELCKIAAAAYAADSKENTPVGILFRNLAAAPTWDPGYNRFTDCVKRALAKSASLLGLAGGVHNSLGGNSLKALLATGALGGVGVGSLAFLLNRNASQTSAENAEILEKVRAFKQLRRDIEEDVASDQLIADALPKRKERYSV